MGYYIKKKNIFQVLTSPGTFSIILGTTPEGLDENSFSTNVEKFVEKLRRIYYGLF
jgi:hypothetical protein